MISGASDAAIRNNNMLNCRWYFCPVSVASAAGRLRIGEARVQTGAPGWPRFPPRGREIRCAVAVFRGIVVAYPRDYNRDVRLFRDASRLWIFANFIVPSRGLRPREILSRGIARARARDI